MKKENNRQKLCVKRLFFNNEVVGYRFEQNVCCGLSLDVSLEDKEEIEYLLKNFYCVSTSNILMSYSKEGILVTPFEGGFSYSLELKHYKDFAREILEENINWWQDVLCTLNKEKIKCERVIQYLQDIHTCVEGIGSMIIHKSGNKLMYEVYIEDFLSVFGFLNHFLEKCVLDGISLNVFKSNESEKMKFNFNISKKEKDVYTLYKEFCNRLGKSIRCVKDLGGYDLSINIHDMCYLVLGKFRYKDCFIIKGSINL